MSDILRDLRKKYKRNVSRSFRHYSDLCPIPEHPELEARGMWPEPLQALQLSLRYLAPLALLAAAAALLHRGLLLQAFARLRDFLTAILKPNDNETELILQWLSSVSPIRVTKLDQVWRHGWLLCEALNQALPGACRGHLEGDISIEHGQALCEQYLGVAVEFSREDFQSTVLIKRRELIDYLVRVRQSLARLSPVVTRNYTRTHNELHAYTLDYVARGTGLTTAQTYKKVSFKIYPTAQQCLEPAEIYISIVGPDQKIGKTVIPPIFGRAQLLRQAFLGASVEYTEVSLPLTQGASYLRQFRRNDINKTFFIPKQAIDIETRVKKDHAVVTYTPTMEGIYEITITSNGYNLVGSPFRANASEDIVDDSSTTSSEINEESEMEVTETKKERKIVLRIVDFVTEKMIMNENGTLVKISDEEAKALIKSEIRDNSNNNIQIENESKHVKDSQLLKECSKFRDTGKKIMKILDVCNILKATLNKGNESFEKQQQYEFRTNCNIPDILNTTVYSKTRHSIQTDQFEDKKYNKNNQESNVSNTHNSTTDKDENLYTKIIYDTSLKESSPQIDRMDILNINNSYLDHTRNMTNPFLYETELIDFKTDKINAYGGNNPFLNENNINHINKTADPESSKIDIVLDYDSEETSNNFINPFPISNEQERPKTPLLKILNDDSNTLDTNFIDPTYDYQHTRCADDYPTEYLNPFYVSKICQNIKDDAHRLTTNFQIGAPVSSTHTLLHSPVPDMDSIILSPNLVEALDKYDKKVKLLKQENIPPTPTHTKTIVVDEFVNESKVFLENKILQVDNDFVECINSEVKTLNNHFRDSAYVSIDEQNNAVDLKQNLTKEVTTEQIYTDGTENYCDLIYTEPVEDKTNISNTKNVNTSYNNLSQIKTMHCHNEPDLLQISAAHSILSAFTDLNDIYRNYTTTDDNHSLQETTEKDNFNSIEVYFTKHINDHVDSASENISDVKRHSNSITATSISEVQSNAAESLSASRAQLDNSEIITTNIPEWDDQIMFGEDLKSFVSESKKFWDAKIKASQEITQQEERKWNEVMKQSKAISTSKEIKNIEQKEIVKYNQRYEPSLQLQNTIKLVPKWKNYWDDVLRDIQKNNSGRLRKVTVIKDNDKTIENAEICQDNDEKQLHSQNENQAININRDATNKKLKTDINSAQLPREYLGNSYNNFKFEIPSANKLNINSNDCIKDIEATDEELLEAFETSPKRFFGKSRSNIFGKIDRFNKRAHNDEADVNNYNSRTDLVSNCISLFNIGAISSDNVEKNISVMKNINLPFNTSSTNIGSNEKENFDSNACNADNNLDAVVSKQNNNNDTVILKTSEKSLIKSKDQNITTRRKSVDIGSVKNEKIISRSDNIIGPNTECNSHVDNVHEGFDKIIKQNYNTFKLCNSNKRLDKENNANNKSFKANMPNCPQNKAGDTKNRTKENHIVKANDNGTLLQSCTETVTDTANHVNQTISRCTNKPFPLKNGEQITKNNTFSVHCNKPNDAHDTNNIINEFNPKLNFKSNLEINPKFQSEIDISKLHQNDTDINKSKSVGDLQTVNVRSYIIIFEKSTEEDKSEIKLKTKQSTNHSSTKNTVQQPQKVNVSDETVSNTSEKSTTQEDVQVTLTSENKLEKVLITSASDNVHEIDDEHYRERFSSAKNFFKSLETSKQNTKKTVKLNECELMLRSTESQIQTASTSTRTHKDDKGITEKKKLPKVSEKFQVEELFNDIAGDGKLTRSCSFRGIPRKKAVLDTFKSMEKKTNVTYETDDDLPQTVGSTKPPIYSTEYPYLSQTAPSECASRFDKEAYGLITRKELLTQSKKIRRRSAPNMSRLNEKFTASM